MYQIIIDRVTLLAKAKGESPTAAMRAAGVGHNFFVELRKGQKPSFERINKLADYFAVTTDYLLGKADEPSPSHDLDPDAELWEIRRAMAEKPGMRTLFSLAKTADKDTLEFASEMIKRMQRDSGYVEE